MDLSNPTEENLQYILNELSNHLNIVNRELMQAEDYDLNQYEDIKFMYDMVKQKGQLSPSETQAFISELSSVRKS